MMKKALALSALLLSSSVLAQVTVDAPYARAVPPGQPNSAAFMTLVNDSDAVSVVGGSSSASDVVELHTHTHENGVMRMRRINSIDIPANGEAVLKPGGLHIMLIGLKQQLKPEQTIDLTLEFSDGNRQTLTLPVKSVMGGMKMKHGKGQGHQHHHEN
ncbi:MAG: copper chaperone PCu(A)C [Marinobacterium sp.]|nr:copper chaperone PCu(A)C [Marinobacterium sp.]